MQILNNYHEVSGVMSEFEMQEQVDLFLKEQIFLNKTGPIWTEMPKIVLREFRVPEVGRISDHVLLINNKRAINIECKLEDIEGVIRQAKDHLGWCDYSVICYSSR